MILGGERGPHEIVEERRSTINFHNLAKAKTLKMKAITKIMLPTDGLTNQLTRGTKKKIPTGGKTRCEAATLGKSSLNSLISNKKCYSTAWYFFSSLFLSKVTN